MIDQDKAQSKDKFLEANVAMCNWLLEGLTAQPDGRAMIQWLTDMLDFRMLYADFGAPSNSYVEVSSFASYLAHKAIDPVLRRELRLELVAK